VIHFKDSDLPALARLYTDTDFQVVVNRLQEALHVLAMDSLKMEGAALHRTQGAALLIQAILDELEEARPKIERIQRSEEKRK